MEYLYNNTQWNNVGLRGKPSPLNLNTHVEGGGEKIIRLWENKWIDALTRSSHDLALWFLLRLDLLDGLQRKLPRRVQLQQLLEQLRHVGALFRRRLDVLAFPHLLKSKMDFRLFTNLVVLSSWYRCCGHCQKVTDCDWSLTWRASPIFLATCLLLVSSSHLLPTSMTGMPLKSPFTCKFVLARTSCIIWSHLSFHIFS